MTERRWSVASRCLAVALAFLFVGGVTQAVGWLVLGTVVSYLGVACAYGACIWILWGVGNNGRR